MEHRTHAYWPTRIMLAVGLIVTAAVILGAGVLLRESELCLGYDDRTSICLPANVVQEAFGVVLAMVGLVWMIRICRGPRDEPPPWRYRDR